MLSTHRLTRSSSKLLLLVGALLHNGPTMTIVEARLGESLTSSNTLDRLLSRWYSPPQGANATIQANEYEGSPRREVTSEMRQFIVRFDQNPQNIPTTREEIAQRAQEVATYLGGTVLHLYEHVFPGAAIGNLPPAAAMSVSSTAIPAADDDSSTLRTFQSEDAVVPSFSFEEDRAIGNILSATNVVVQDQAPAPLDRINQKSLPLDGVYDYAYDGRGVKVFVLDSGVKADHVEFSDISVTCGFNAMAAEEPSCDDLNGHGTHVAGSIASRTFGVAKRATIVSVKIVNKDGAGTFASVLAGLDYVLAQKLANPTTPMVVNMSIAGGRIDSANDAVNAVADAGVVIVAAAGNANGDACQASPASATGAIAVGASRPVSPTATSGFFHTLLSRFIPTRGDRRAEFSNYGTCVDLFAYGVGVVSLGRGSTTELATKSGTSMSSPHVAGAAALYLSRNPSLTAAQVKQLLLQDASAQQMMMRYQMESPNLTLNTKNVV
jgi:subtilisin family serine protease